MSPESVVEAGEPRDEQPADDGEDADPEGDPNAASRKAAAAAEVAATNRQVG
jgi:hypothetical protein